MSQVHVITESYTKTLIPIFRQMKFILDFTGSWTFFQFELDADIYMLDKNVSKLGIVNEEKRNAGELVTKQRGKSTSTGIGFRVVPVVEVSLSSSKPSFHNQPIVRLTLGLIVSYNLSG